MGYGVVASVPSDESLVEIREMVEKPPVDEAPSDLAIMGRYVLTPGIFDAIDATAPGRGMGGAAAHGPSPATAILALHAERHRDGGRHQNQGRAG